MKTLKDSSVNLDKLTKSELEDVIYNCNTIIKRIQRLERLERKERAKTELSIGDYIEVVSNRFKDEIWEVIKLNPKKVKCMRENGEIWNIPYSNIQSI